MRELSWIILFAGLWEIVISFLPSFRFITSEIVNSTIIGIILVLLGAWGALTHNTRVMKGLDWFAAMIGLWLIVSPFIFVTAVVPWNDVIVGAIVLVSGIWSALVVPHVTV